MLATVTGALATLMVIAIVVLVVLGLIRLVSGDWKGAAFAGLAAVIIAILL